MNRLDIESNVITCCKSATDWKNAHLKVEYFTELQLVFERYNDYVRDNNEIPPLDYMVQQYPNLKINTYVDQLSFNEAVHLLHILNDSEQLLEDIETFKQDMISSPIGEKSKAISKFCDKIYYLRKIREGRLNASILVDYGNNIVDRYVNMVNNTISQELQFPFQTLINHNVDFDRGDLGIIYAQAGTGKSWILLWLMFYWAMNKKKGLLISFEMNASQCERRLDLIIANAHGLGLNIPDLKNPGFVNSDKFKQLLKIIEDRNIKELIHIRTPHKSGKISAARLDSILSEEEYDYVLIDGIYFMKEDDSKKEKENSYEWKEQHKLLDELKSLALLHNIPIFGTTQATGETIGDTVRKSKTDSNLINYGNNVAFGQAVSRVADLVFELEKVVDEKGQLKIHDRKIRVVKVRHNALPPKKVNVNFNPSNGIIEEKQSNVNQTGAY